MHVVQKSNLAAYLPELAMRDGFKKVVEIPMPSWPSFQQPVYLTIRSDSISNAYYKALQGYLKALLRTNRP